MAYRRRIYSFSDVKPLDAKGNQAYEDGDFFDFMEELRFFEREFEKSMNNEPKIAKKTSPRYSSPYQTKTKKSRIDFDSKVYQLGKHFKSEAMPFYHHYDSVIRYSGISESEFDRIYLNQLKEEIDTENPSTKKEKKENIGKKRQLKSFLLPPISYADFKKISISFGGAALILAVIFSVLVFSEKFNLKGKVMGESQEGYQNLTSAIESIKNQDFQSSSIDFESAYQNFSSVSKDLNSIGGSLTNLTKFLPVASKLSSGKNMAEAGKHIALAGKLINSLISDVSSLKNPLAGNNTESSTLLDLFQSSENNLKSISAELEQTQNYLNNVKVDDLPGDKQEEFVALKSKLPLITRSIDSFLKNSHIFTDLLGGNGPRKYMFLFQNNQEMRATGGFIGTYGLLDINNGQVRSFIVDGIFNPDGQLKEKIVPPKPIQKVSAAWSLHDSNWFPDFPTSARKAILFYEKTGGPTADGIITLTPSVMEKMLEVTGPIEMSDYGVTIDSQNFIEKTQYEVEIDYDKVENEPKRIISDLAPIVIEKIFNARDFKSLIKVIGILSDALKEKQILLYSQNEELENLISEQGWSGEMFNTPKDYLSVINTNINGYKTDGVIDEKIEHLAEIQKDGSIIDTIAITRKHNGGNSAYNWWNKVNADYMRVYVPLGAKLLEVKGQTREFNNPPLDYEALGFKRDPDVKREEENMIINEDTGTRTYEDFGKTVFANWVYVSPQESVTIQYKYQLPFKLAMNDTDKPADSYSLLAQKQSGSKGSQLISEVAYPGEYDINWKYPDNLEHGNNSLKLDTDLKTDKFIGAVFLSRQK